MKISKAWLSKQILCKIACNYKCCNSPTFNATFKDEAEMEKINVKYNQDINTLTVPQEGHCRFLKYDNTGCLFNEDRPAGCRIFPIELRDNRLQVSNWCMQQCPKPMNYELVTHAVTLSLDKGIYNFSNLVYKYKLKTPHHNKLEEIILKYPIEETPPIYIMLKDDLTKYFGSTFYSQLKEVMENPNVRGSIII